MQDPEGTTYWTYDALDGVYATFGLVLDTEQGTRVLLTDGDEVDIDGENVALKAFPASRRYRRLICSVKNDHIALSCVWPRAIDLRE